MRQNYNIFEGIDWLLVFIYILLVGFGWVNIYATSVTDDLTEVFDLTTKHGKQLLWIGLSIPLIVLILFFNASFFERYASIFYIISLLFLVLLFPFGKEINGATSWFDFGGISLQPSEFAKVFTALAVAKLLNDRKYDFNLIANQLKAIAIIFIPAFLILLQPDAGSATVYLAFIFVFNREGLSHKYITFGVAFAFVFICFLFFGKNIVIGVLFSIVFLIVSFAMYKKGASFLKNNWFKIILLYAIIIAVVYGMDYTYNNVFKQHHRDRFEVLLGIQDGKKDVGYNSFQSELTISSGGFMGKGFMKGDITHGAFVPAQHTDYIFTTVGEEWGFVGSVMVIILFTILMFRIIYLSEIENNKFGRIYGYSVASILFFHLFVNIGMVIGLLPTIGIPLPFFSYGGSSLWSFTILLFIFIRLDALKNYDF